MSTTMKIRPPAVQTLDLPAFDLFRGGKFVRTVHGTAAPIMCVAAGEADDWIAQDVETHMDRIVESIKSPPDFSDEPAVVVPDEVVEAMEDESAFDDFDRMNLSELKEQAKTRAIPGRSKMNKAQLLAALREFEGID